MDYNHIALMGRLTRDPELRYTPSGTPVANFGLAVNRHFRQADELKEEVCYLEVACFGRTAENTRTYLHKGDPVLVDGRLRQRRWETDGQPRSTYEVVAETVLFLSGRREGGERSANATNT